MPSPATATETESRPDEGVAYLSVSVSRVDLDRISALAAKSGQSRSAVTRDLLREALAAREAAN